MKKKNQPIMCEECFALTEECECEAYTISEDEFEEVLKPAKKYRSDKWEPNISKNEKWENVKSDYKAYKEGV